MVSSETIRPPMKSSPCRFWAWEESEFIPGPSMSPQGQNFSCAVTSTGNVYCWGLNTNGQLGVNTTTNHHAPVEVLGVGGVGDLSNIVQRWLQERRTLAPCPPRAMSIVGDTTATDSSDIGNTTQKLEPVEVGGVGGCRPSFEYREHLRRRGSYLRILRRG